MYLKLSEDKGFTLIETIIAMAIIVIIVVVILNIFGSSITNIFISGEKNKAISLAAEKIEQLYSMQPLGDDEIKTELIDNHKGHYIASGGNLYTYYMDKDFNFSIEPYYDEEDLVGYNVTLVYFYHDGEHHVTITAFIRGDK